MIKNLLFVSALSFAAMCNAQASLNFDGVNDVAANSDVPVSFNGTRTIEAWIKTSKNSLPPNQGGLGQSVIVDMGKQLTGSRFTFCILQNNALRIEVQGSGLSATTAVNDGNWHHVAVVYDKDATSNKFKIYLDGSLDKEGDLSTGVSTSSTGVFHVGLRVDGNSPFQGDIDEVRVWNVARSQAEIQADMNKEYCGTQTGLIRYYKFNEGAPGSSNSSYATVKDRSGNIKDLTLTDFALSGSTSNYSTQNSALILTTLDKTVTYNNNVLTAGQANATYQWYDCTNNTDISGATSQTYTPTANGSYAVKLNLNGCMDMSSCVQVSNLAVEDIDLVKNANVYPNPSSGEFNISFGQKIDELNYVVYSASGQVVDKGNKENIENLTVNFDAPKGVYYLQVKNSEGKPQTIPLIKE